MTERFLWRVTIFILVLAGAAAAHPLGNFTVNHYSRIEVEKSQVKIRAVLDLAEVPTFQATSEIDADKDGSLSTGELDAYAEKISPKYNSCRIIYVLEETGAVEHYGFAFGTLPGHSEEGEERFTVEWRRADDSVWYELLAFARPHHVLARIGFPFVGLFQRKFALDSGRAMLSACER